VTPTPWQRRIQRAEELASHYPFVGEILRFYIHVARFQEQLQRGLSGTHELEGTRIQGSLRPGELLELGPRFEAFLGMAEKRGPERLAAVSRELRDRGPDFWSELLAATWESFSTSDAQGFLAAAFLQPYAELLRSRTSPAPAQGSGAVCAFCKRTPCFGVMRPRGEGAARWLGCCFCLAEWEFRRIVCAGCGEENDQKLVVFSATDFECVRVECCETCKTYIKTIDLTKNGLAEPVVDELASAPLDLWARERGYAKLHANLFGM
jgi:formate dehydrogenase accessory protein FdhE